MIFVFESVIIEIESVGAIFVGVGRIFMLGGMPSLPAGRNGELMRFHGFQKLTLLDYPEKVACTLFTAGCNLRCPFCHNAALVTHVSPDASYDEEQIIAFLKKRQGLLEGVCITGGEPLLMPELPGFIQQVKALGYAVKLDTNGTSPDALSALTNAGLIDFVAMDIKNSKQKYALTTGIPDLDLSVIERSVELLLHGKIPYEFRTTVVKELHTCHDIEEIAEWIAGANTYCLQGFVDSGDLIGTGLHAHDAQTMHKMQNIASQTISNVFTRGL